MTKESARRLLKSWSMRRQVCLVSYLAVSQDPLRPNAPMRVSAGGSTPTIRSFRGSKRMPQGFSTGSTCFFVGPCQGVAALGSRQASNFPILIESKHPSIHAQHELSKSTQTTCKSRALSSTAEITALAAGPVSSL
ncbi:hypothetical protein MAPG_02033 [Magnaporthiopsis poae ATCC 64411]|uniref:Uncharacterized protein n=1 Tax=Magnaporthiopsis poae (strain ATCC 64411 / 73-15) TaxID=644358 RepID=A0A0C4DQ95_MAGP6|nr:hypothetical protein MAPG_02033 [Magnaporthiopsis poae ATCC 64411]